MKASQLQPTFRIRPQPIAKTPGLVAASFVILSNVALFSLFLLVGVILLRGWANS